MFVYAIESKISGRIYIGQTRDVEMRLSYHNSGYVKSTKMDKPWKLIALEEFEDKKSSRWRERQLKKSKGRKVQWIERNSVV
jgi:putative endonuclease